MNDDTFLHRQINPSWVQSSRVTHQAFKPSSRDDKRLSVYDGDIITAEDAWTHYTEELKCTSIGVLAVSCHDCTARELPVEPDPTPYPAHAVINFTAYSNTQIRTKAKQLTVVAVERGWQYEMKATP